ASFERSVWISTNTTLRATSIASAQARRDGAGGPRMGRRLLGVRMSSHKQSPGRGEEARHPPAIVQVLLPEASGEDSLLGEHPHQLEPQRGGQDQGAGPPDDGQERGPAANHLAKIE